MEKQSQWAGSMEGAMCQELFMETIWWRESKDTQIARLITHDDTEKLGNLLWLADIVLGNSCQKMDCSLQK